MVQSNQHIELTHHMQIVMETVFVLVNILSLSLCVYSCAFEWIFLLLHFSPPLTIADIHDCMISIDLPMSLFSFFLLKYSTSYQTGTKNEIKTKK